MNLPERFGIERLVEFLDRFFDQRLAAVGDDLRVFIFGLKIDDVVDGDHLHRRSERRANPPERHGGGFALGEPGEQCSQVDRRQRKPRLEPRYDLGDSLGRHRLPD